MEVRRAAVTLLLGCLPLLLHSRVAGAQPMRGAAAALAGQLQGPADKLPPAVPAAAGTKQQPSGPLAQAGARRDPFPQCTTQTLSYDVLFVGQPKYAQVGPVRYVYHRFGPMIKSGFRQPQPAAGAPAVADERGGRAAQQQREQREREQRAPLVLIPGLGASMYMWPVPMLTALAETREVIIFDNMRSGLSTDASSPQQPLSVALMANSTLALFNQLRLKQPDIWGWSLGGSVAYALLAYHGDKIGNAVIASGSPGGPASFLAPDAVYAQLLGAGNKLNRLLPLMFPQGVDDAGVCSWFAASQSFAASEFTSLAAPLDTKALQAQVAALQDFSALPGINQRLSTRANRVLIMHGVQDRIVPVRNAPAADNLLLGAWMLQFPGAGHALPFDQPQAMIFMTEEFLRFAEPLTPEEHRAWTQYGRPAAAAEGASDAAAGLPPRPAVASGGGGPRVAEPAAPLLPPRARPTMGARGDGSTAAPDAGGDEGAAGSSRGTGVPRPALPMLVPLGPPGVGVPAATAAVLQPRGAQQQQQLPDTPNEDQADSD